MKNGTYPAVAVGFDMGRTPKKQTPYVRVRFKLVNCAHAGEFANYDGWLTDNAVEYLFKALRAAGWTGDDISGPLMEQGLGSVICNVVVENESYEDRNGQRKTAARIQFVNPFDDGAPRLGDAALGQGEREDFGARFRSIAQSVPSVSGPSSEGAVSTPTAAAKAEPEAKAPPSLPPMSQDEAGFGNDPPPLTDDDLPF